MKFILHKETCSSVCDQNFVPTFAYFISNARMLLQSGSRRLSKKFYDME